MAGKPVFILNGIGLGAFPEPEIDGKPVAAITARRVLSRFSEVAVLVEADRTLPDLPGVFLIPVSKNDVFTAFSAVLETYPDRDVYLFGDLYAPFLEPELGERYAGITVDRIAHYTYGEHYPRGVAPHALSGDAVKILRNVASGNYTPMDDEAFMDLMGLDINSYDIEVDVSPDDFRRYRLDFRARSRERLVLIEQLGRELEEPDYPALSRLLLDRQDLHRSIPAYVEMDLSDNCSLACDFCPREAMGLSGVEDGPVMNEELALRIVGELAGLNPDACLCLSPFSEPLKSPLWKKVAEKALGAGLHVFIETNGLGMDESFRSWFLAQDADRLTAIVSLDLLTAEEYSRYKKSDRFEDAVANTRALLTSGARNCYLQIVYMDELSEVIDAFYDFWSEYEDRVLPRKYNSFCGRLPERSTQDLSPLTRFPCWHLKRDMVIRTDGRVLLCKQDLDGSGFDGDLNRESLEEVWLRLADRFRDHLSGEEWGIGLCKDCDEWHTFNF